MTFVSGRSCLDELERLVSVERHHAAIEQDDLDLINRIAEYAQSPRDRRTTLAH